MADAEMDAEMVGEVRRRAKEVTGGNCTFADDDLHMLSSLAWRACQAGLIQGMNAGVQAKICEIHGLDPAKHVEEKTPSSRDRAMLAAGGRDDRG